MELVNSTKRYIREHPLGSFFIVAFGIPFLVIFLLGVPKIIRGEVIETIDTILMGAAQFIGPITAAILITFVVDGKRGIRNIFNRMKKWRLGKWYLTLLIFPVLILVVSFLLSATVSSDFFPVLFIGNIMMGVLAGFLEEIGWMGFAFPMMRKRYGLIRSSIYLGILHGVWHMPLWFVIQFSDLGGYWFPYFIAFFVLLIALRVVIVWAYSKTNSLLLAQLIHVSSTGFLAVLTPIYTEPINWFIFYSVYAVFLSGIALIAIRKMAGFSKLE